MTLEDAMKQVLAEMGLLQYGKTTSWNRSGGDSERDLRPVGESHTLADEWRLKWERDPIQRTVDDARAALQAWRVRQAPADGDDSTEEDWIVEDGEGYSVEQVARKFNTTPTRVRKLRMARDRDVEFGLPKRFAREQVPTRERVLNLAERGCTVRQIAWQTDVPKSTVQRWLKEAA